MYQKKRLELIIEKPAFKRACRVLEGGRLTMKLTHLALASGLILTACSSDTQAPAADSKAGVNVENVASTDLCTDMGPQTPRDITNLVGSNPMMFTMAPASTEMNLCNIHTHTNAEHKGPGFSVFVNDSDSGGYACNDAGSLSDLELLDPYEGQGAYNCPIHAKTRFFA